MPHYYLLFLLALVLAACQPAVNTSQTPATPTEVAPDPAQELPADLQAVLEAHGGLAQWGKQGSLSYHIPRDNGHEKQFIDLIDRRERIEGSNFTMGYDGTNYWLDADTTEYKSNPIFYKNLMFYFYAMPFVLADPGIQYEEVAPLQFEGTAYPGFRISYDPGTGVSPEDEYFLHYDPSTKQMAWLGYTVTYYSQEKSDRIKWIRYDDWQAVQGFQLPRSMAWYNVEENKPTTERSRQDFIMVKLATQRPVDSLFAPTPNAMLVRE